MGGGWSKKKTSYQGGVIGSVFKKTLPPIKEVSCHLHYLHFQNYWSQYSCSGRFLDCLIHARFFFWKLVYFNFTLTSL